MRYYINQTSEYLLQARPIGRGFDCRRNWHCVGLGAVCVEQENAPGVQEADIFSGNGMGKPTALKCRPHACQVLPLQGGCDYEVSSVYLWTVGGSWDVLGL